MKYIREEKEEKILLSTYLKELESFIKGKHILQDEYDVEYLKYLITLFGNIELEGSLVREFIRSFGRCGGRYSVMSDDDTFKGLLALKKRYPYLSTEAIKDISYLYIKDLYDLYALDEVIDEYVSVYGKTDEAIEKYISYVDEFEEKVQEKYIEDSKLLKEEVLSLGYTESFSKFLATLVSRKHYDYQDILKCLPDSELVKKDEEHLLEIATRYRITYGAGYPMSYVLTKKMVKDSELKDYSEELSYSVRVGDLREKIPTTFTKSEFIESTKKKEIVK